MKLNELLGSQSVVVGQADKVRQELASTFEKKRHLFEEKLTTFTADAEGGAAVTEEQSAIQTTVPSELKWITPILAKAMDSEAAIDEANMSARADVLLDNGTKILSNVPATQLMQLDKRLGELLQFVQSIPTLDPAKGYSVDPSRPPGVYQARQERKRRTKKDAIPIVLYPATKEHPAQTQLIQKDVEIGTIVSQSWSGLITPATKATMLERIEELRRAVKQARSRANDIEAKPINVGGKVLDYVFGAATS